MYLRTSYFSVNTCRHLNCSQRGEPKRYEQTVRELQAWNAVLKPQGCYQAAVTETRRADERFGATYRHPHQ